jgi:hypothetical protein
LLQSSLSAQFYAEGGFEMGFLNQKETNRIVSEFNIRENHNIADFKSLSGFRFGFGRYGRFTNMEISFGNIAKKQISKNPNLLKETAELTVNSASLDASLSYRPLRSQFLSVGAAIHFGQVRYRYSFGGDYKVPMVQYGIWGEVFADLALRFRFLLKKEAREDMFYLFKFRPSYRLHPQYDISNLQREFNQDNLVQNGDRMESLSNFGFRISLVIPFLNETERFYYKKGGTLDQERLKKKMERMEKTE